MTNALMRKILFVQMWGHTHTEEKPYKSSQCYKYLPLQFILYYTCKYILEKCFINAVIIKNTLLKILPFKTWKKQ